MRSNVPNEAVVRPPHDAAQSYRALPLWDDITIPQMLRRTAAAHPSRVAVVTLDDSLMYAELDRRSDAFAVGLLSCGLEPGDPVLFQLGNCVEFTVAWYGTLKAGLLPVATLPVHDLNELVPISAQIRPRAHLIQGDLERRPLGDLAAALRREQPSIEHTITVRSPTSARDATYDALIADGGVPPPSPAGPDDVAVFQLSGGTTGTPKIIPRFHAEYLYNARLHADFWDYDDTTAVLHVLPLVHNAGVSAAMHPAHAMGSRLVMGAPTPDSIAATMATLRPTDMLVTPGLAAAIVAATKAGTLDTGSLRNLTVAGQRLPLALADEIETVLGIPCTQLFGMGEGMFLATPRDGSEWGRKNTVGVPYSSADEIRIYEPGTQTPVTPGDVGELCCRGPYTIRGYYAAPEHNAVAFTPDGFYRTGDLARADDIEGQTWYAIEGRIKDLINRGAEKINAEELENLIFRHPAVAQVALVAVPDERLGERACACVVPAPGTAELSLDDLCAFLLSQGVAKFKLPEYLQLFDALPVTTVNKVDKRALRSAVADLASG